VNSFFVHGVPTPKGSARALRGTPYGPPCPSCKQRKTGHPRVFSDNANLKGWEQAIRGTARASRAEKITGPVEVDLEFHMPRPKGHWGTGRNAHKLKPSAPLFHYVKPDLDKLERAVLDGLAQICFGDDTFVVRLNGSKFYSSTPGVHIYYREATVWTPRSMKQESPSQGELPLAAGTRTAKEST